MLQQWLASPLDLYLDAAPWLLLGLVAAGLIKAWVPETAMLRWLGGSGPVLRAAVAGAPLPLCSCSVLPAAFGRRRAGASRGATVSFLIATPETRVDSVTVSYALLGPFMAVERPFVTLFSAVFTGLLVGWGPAAPAPALVTSTCAGSCGGSGTAPEPTPPPGPVRR
jgi:uncharacterized membrane protein YraQ (UPF0718 family)